MGRVPSPYLAIGIAVALLLTSGGLAEDARKLERSDAKRWSTVHTLAHTQAKSATREFLQQRGKDLLVPMEIDVFLWGFDGDGAYGVNLAVDELTDLLTHTFTEHCPTVWDSGAHAGVCFSLNVQVAKPQPGAPSLHELEELISSSMGDAGQSHLPGHGDVAMYDVDGQLLEPLLDRFLDNAYASSTPEDRASFHNHNAIFVLNPSKPRMLPKGDAASRAHSSPKFLEEWKAQNLDMRKLNLEESNYLYRYNYGGVGGSATWISKRGYAVIDVTAGPCVYGPAISRAGSVSPASLPIIQDIMTKILHELKELPQGTVLSHAIEQVSKAQHKLLCGQLAAVVMSCAQYVFLPDIKTDHVERAERVLVPIVVIADHHEEAASDDFSSDKPEGAQDHPLGGASGSRPAHEINTMHIQEEVQGMLGPEQVAMISIYHHYLHHHKGLAAALHKAMHSHSQAVVESEHQQMLHTHHNVFVDSEALLEEFALAADTLTGGAIRYAHHMGGGPNIGMGGFAGHLRRPRFMDMANRHPLRHSGTRVLPVFVLRLKDMPTEELLFNTRELVAANRDCVVVLQLLSRGPVPTGYEEVFTGHLIDGSRVMVDPTKAERNIIAGVASALTGMTPPYQRWDSKGARFTYDYLWAVGAHPFGSYSNYSGLGAIHRAIAQRNVLVSHAEAAVADVAGRLALVDEFVAENFEGPFAHLHESEPRHYLDALAKQRHGYSAALQTDVVARVEAELAKVEEKLEALSWAMYRQDFVESDELLSKLLPDSAMFTRIVDKELDAAEDTLSCCSLRTSQVYRRSLQVVLVLAGIALLVFLVLLAVACSGGSFGTLGPRKGGGGTQFGLPTYVPVPGGSGGGRQQRRTTGGSEWSL